MNDNEQKEREKALDKAYKFFKANKKISSAALGFIKLNSDGFRHLVFRDKQHKRELKNQLKRFELLRYLKPTLEGMKYYQEYFETKQQIRIKRQSTTLLEFGKVKYWGFIAVINDKIRIKVVLRQVGDGSIIFWSIIPFWKTKNYKDISTINLPTGNIEND